MQCIPVIHDEMKMTSIVDINDLLDRFDAFLKVKKLRMTPERLALLQYIMGFKDHFTPEMLLHEANSNSFHVSNATIYNTLNLLVEAKLLRRHSIENLPVQYEIAPGPPHFHLVCTSCGKVKEVRDNHFIAFMNTRKYNAFNAEYFSLYAYGTCSTCARKKKRNAAIVKKSNNK